MASDLPQPVISGVGTVTGPTAQRERLRLPKRWERRPPEVRLQWLTHRQERLIRAHNAAADRAARERCLERLHQVGVLMARVRRLLDPEWFDAERVCTWPRCEYRASLRDVDIVAIDLDSEFEVADGV